MFVGAKESRRVAPGGVPHDEDAVRIAAVSGDVLVDPAEGLGNVFDQRPHFYLGQQAVVDGDEDEPFSVNARGFT